MVAAGTFEAMLREGLKWRLYNGGIGAMVLASLSRPRPSRQVRLGRARLERWLALTGAIGVALGGFYGWPEPAGAKALSSPSRPGLARGLADGARAPTASGLLSWGKPGRYRFVVPRAAAGGILSVSVVGGSGGGGDAGWVRGKGQGTAYTCQALKECWGAGGGGGGASALVGPGHFLLVATGGGGGGGGVKLDAGYGSSGLGGNGGSGAEVFALVPVAGGQPKSCALFSKLPGALSSKLPGALSTLHFHGCVRPGEVLTVVVGAGGQGAQGGRPGAGGAGYGGHGGRGGLRCGGAGQSGQPFSGGGGGGAACYWGKPGGAGGAGAYGGGGGAGTQPSSSCAAGEKFGPACALDGGAGGGFVGEGAPKGTYRGVNGQAGHDGGGAGGAGRMPVNPSLGAGTSKGGAGSAGPSGGAGQNGEVTVEY